MHHGTPIVLPVRAGGTFSTATAGAVSTARRGGQDRACE
jgi:hypothetical protein